MATTCPDIPLHQLPLLNMCIPIKHWLVLFIGCIWSGLGAQTPADSLSNTFRYRKIVGLNMTPLLTQLVPFNRSDPKDAGPFLVHFKSYKRSSRVAFRFSLGVHLVPNGDFDFDNPQAALAIGWEKRRSISRRWSYTKGFDLMFFGGPLNVPGSEEVNDAVIAVGPVWGLEFALDRRITIGCEAALSLGLSLTQEIISFNLIPPVGVFLNHYF